MSTEIVREPRWPALVGMMAAGGVYLGLPEPFTVGPSWLLLAVVVILMIPLVVSYRRGHHNVARLLTFAAHGAIPIGWIASRAVLIQGIPQHRFPPLTLLRSAGAMWITNIMVFGLWYWQLEDGEERRRARAGGCLDSSFLFPQMLMREDADPMWSPDFVDYL